jgi:tetratricopeptide (TPR) repeat protein
MTASALRPGVGVVVLSVLFALICPSQAQTLDPVLPVLPDLNSVDIEPLPDLAPALPFASPRDAARYRMQLSLAAMRERNDVRAALRGLLQAALLDRGYSLPLYNLAVLCQTAGDWESSVGFFEELEKREDAALQQIARRELPRARLLARLNQDAKGKLKLRYDVELVKTWDADATLKDTAKRIALWEKLIAVDSERYEAYVRLGALLADQGQVSAAVEKLTLGAKYVPLQENPRIELILGRATREWEYNSAVRTARAAMRLHDYQKASQFFEKAWQSRPEQGESGLDAAAALLVLDDTAKAIAMLSRVRQTASPAFAARAESMLKALRQVEPAAEKALAVKVAVPRTPAPAAAAGSYESMLPPLLKTEMRLLVQPEPRTTEDTERARLLDSFIAGNVTTMAATPEMLDQVTSPPVTGQNPYTEYRRAQFERSESLGPAPEMAVDRSSGAPRARTLMIGSTPTGSPVWLDDEAAPLCTTPCQLTIAGARHTLRVSRSGYVSEQLTVNAKTPNDWAPELQRQRGQIVVDSPEPGARLLLNGKLAAFSLPTRLSLAVGVYLVGTKTPTTEASTFITIVPDRTLRLTVGR